LQVALPETIARKEIAQEEVWLGIHPENLVIHPQEEENTIVVEVHNYEALGAETIVDVNLGLDEADQRVMMKCRIPPDQQVRVGQTVWLELQACSIFDRDTGQAIKSV
jgi:ABC-type sugar transport system ATPase subunit